MGASISKTTLSKNHSKALYSRSSKRVSTKIEPSEFNDFQRNQDTKKKSKFYTRKSKKDVSKSIIGRPTNFIHLNHAGIDYTSMDTLFMPIEEAQLLQINVPTVTNKRLSRVGVESMPKTAKQISNHTINMTMKDYTSFNELRALSERGARKSGNFGAGSPKRKPLNYDALFSDELFTMTHESNINNISANSVATVC